jgi:hypothetical protein
MKKTIAGTLLVGLFTFSCQEPKKNTGTSKQPPKTQTSNVDPNPSEGTALAVASKTVVVPGAGSKTLLDIVKASGKDIGVFQFSGVTCASCMEESPQVVADLTPNLAKVQMYVIFPSAENAYTPSEFQGFVSKYAKIAKYVIDSDQSVLKAIRKNKTQYFGLYILMKKDGTGIILNDDKSSTQVGEKVTSLLGD